MDDSYRNSQRNQACRVGHGVALRMLLGPAPEQISGRAAAESLAVAGHQIADRRERRYPGDPGPRSRVRAPGHIAR